MQRPSPAARRFYRAFYQWTLLSSPAPGALVRQHVSRRALSTSNLLRQEDAGESQRPAAYRTHVAGTYARDEARRKHFEGYTTRNWTSTSHRASEHQAWSTAPAQSSVERPFTSFAAWDEVIRFKTESTIMLEVAVPLYRVRALKLHYGADVEELCRETGAQVELGTIPPRTHESGESKRLCSVLVSGPPEAVGRVRQIFRIFRADRLYEQWVAGRAQEKDRGLEARSAEVVAESKINSAATVPRIGRQAWHDMLVQSHTARPSDTIKHWDYVLRSRSEDGGSGTIERIVPEDIWQTMLHNKYDAQGFIESQTGATVEIGKHAFTGPTRNKKEGGGVVLGSSRSIFTSGTPDQLWGASKSIGTFKGYLPPQRRSATSSPEQSDETVRVPVHPMLLGYIMGSSGRTKNNIRLLSGVARFKESKHRRNTLASIELSGTPEAVAKAGHMIRQLIKTAYQHGNVGLPPLTEAGVDGFMPTPNFFSRVRLRRRDLGPERIRQIEGFVIGRHGLGIQEARLATLCRIDWSQGGWTITGPEEGVEMAKREMQMRVEKCCAADGVPVEELEELEAGLAEAKQSAQEQRSVAKTAREEETAAKLSNNLRAVLRPLTHPVVLITSLLKPSGDLQQASGAKGFATCRGVTVSSFTAVTMHPKPIISFNLKVPSRTWDAMASTNRLCVHILAATPAAAALTHAFTQPHSRPETPFETIVKLGGVTHFSNDEKTRPPTIHHPLAVLARVQAGIIREKCVEVGDHVVLVAEVLDVDVEREKGVEVEEAVKRLDERGVMGLSYARKEYRGREGVEVMEVPEGEENVENVENTRAVEEEDGFGDETHLSEEDDADVFASEATHQAAPRDATSADSAEDAEFDYFRKIQEGGDEEEPTQIAKPKAKRSAAMEEEDDYDLGFGLPAETEERPGGLVKRARHNGSGDAALQDVVDDVLDSARQSPRSVLSTLGKTSSRFHPDGRHKAQARYVGQTRSYSTSTAGSFGTDSVSSAQRVDAREQVTDPSMLKQTVADFLGQSQEWVKPHRMRAVLNAKKAAERASQQLERALSSGTLTEDESLRLERTITANDRRVAKSLALSAADDLRRMLDEGKVHVRIAQWMEQAMERGMVVFVEEAKQVRGMYDRGELDEQQFGLVREGLERGHGVLNTEAMRLKGWFEDEEGEQTFDASVGEAKAPR